MGMAIKIKMLLAARDMSLRELAEALDPPTSANNLSGKMKRDNFSEKDLIDIAKACNASFEGIFTLNDTHKTI